MALVEHTTARALAPPWVSQIWEDVDTWPRIKGKQLRGLCTCQCEELPYQDLTGQTVPVLSKDFQGHHSQDKATDTSQRAPPICGFHSPGTKCGWKIPSPPPPNLGLH